MLFNMVLPSAVAAEEPFAFEYSGNFTDNRDADGKGTVRLNTSGTLVTSGKTVTVRVYILGGGGGAAYYDEPNVVYKHAASGGSGGNQTIEVTLEPGTYEIVIGTGGAPAYATNAASGKITADTGGNTIAFGETCTGGTGGSSYWESASAVAGNGGTPNGAAGGVAHGASASVSGGSPNGGGVVNGVAQNGGNGYVELTFI